MRTTTKNADGDDWFAASRMSFGSHLEELRLCLWRALIGFLICLVLGFVLDGIGYVTGWPIGLGRPVLAFIAKPVEKQLGQFYDRRLEATLQKLQANPDALANRATEFEQLAVPLEQARLLFEGRPIEEINAFPRPDRNAEVVLLWWRIQRPVYWLALQWEAQKEIGRRPALTTLSLQEPFVVYFKVSLVCGVVIASPWVFWHLWSFVAAGLYPHEKRLVHFFLPLSLGLFLGGVFLCEFLVIPKAIEALLWFNEWIGLEPDLRLNEWMGFAIWMPLVFGVSFQTPLVMYFLERIGVLDVRMYREKRRLVYLLLAVFAAVITPSTDPGSMMFLWGPLCLLFEVGIGMCRLFPRPHDRDDDLAESEEMVEV